MTLLTQLVWGAVVCLPLLLLWKLKLFSRSPLDDIPGPPAPSLLKGHTAILFDAKFRDDLYEKYGGVVKLKSAFNVSQLFVRDPAALHAILNRDHRIFELPSGHLTGNMVVFGPGILSVAGESHKKQRKFLGPAFSPAHLREVLPIMYQVAYRLRDGIAAQLDTGAEELDMLSWSSRVALELIGQAGLGCSLDPLKGSGHSPYSEALKSLVPSAIPLDMFRRILPGLVGIGSPAFRRRMIELIPSKALHRMQNIVDTLDVHARRIVAERLNAMNGMGGAHPQQVLDGKDILSRLIRDNVDAVKEETLSEEEIVSQVSTLVFASTDTTTSELSCLLHLISEHQDVQDKMRKEIVEARREKGDLSFDELLELPYLEAVCRETLRLYPPAHLVAKTALEDTVIPLHTSLQSVQGNEISHVHVPKGTKVLIGIAAINRSTTFWGEDALEWKPDRWFSPLPESLAQARIPGIYPNILTFLAGGRACMGLKFSQCEIKAALSILLESFTFELSDAPIKWNVASIQYPSVESRGTPQLPLKVKRILSG